MSGGEDERELVRRAQRGDVEAFALLVRCQQDSVYRLAARTVGMEAAEDVAQQALLKAWRALGSFRGESSFGTWLYRITANLCLDHLRQVGRFRPLPLDEMEAEDPEDAEIAEQVAAAAEDESRKRALAWALEQVPSEDRLLLQWRVGDELSYAAIGELLGVPVRTVGTRLYRARARLHRLVVERLKEDGYELR